MSDLGDLTISADYASFNISFRLYAQKSHSLHEYVSFSQM